MARFLSIDNVNLAFSLENFDPRIHQPQPPGYPLFVALARIVNFFAGDAALTFVALSVLVSALCLPVLFSLGRRMFGPWVGAAAVFLFLVNPVFWHSGLDGPLRPNLALFSLLSGYCAWRCWQGERMFLYWGAAVVGVGSGFRPDLLAFMLPLWLVSAWIGTHSFRAVFEGIIVMGAVVLAWVGGLIYAVGGARELWQLSVEYLIDQSKVESVLLGAAESGWLRQMNRLAIWNGLAVVAWVWAVPFFLRSKTRVGLLSSESAFMLVWLIPGLVLQALIHVAAPGHTLFSIPILCLAGGYFIHVAAGSTYARDVALSAALVVNAMLFLNFFPLPLQDGAPAGIWRSAKNALAYGMFESSLSNVRWLDEISRLSLKEIEDFTPQDRPTIIVSSDVHYRQWFMNWRIARYYVPDSDIWVLADQKTPRMAQLVRRDKTLESRSGPIVTVRVPRAGRIIWLIEQNAPFHKALVKVLPVTSGAHVLYSDVPPDGSAFRVLEYEFVPAGLVSEGVPQ